MKRRILIIDDDEDILDILHIIFSEEGFNVIVSNTGEAAERIDMVNPDLILLDVRIDGYPKRGDEICSEIKASYSHKLPVILISAETDLAMLASHCGADLYFQKPFDIDDLLLKVKSCLA